MKHDTGERQALTEAIQRRWSRLRHEDIDRAGGEREEVIDLLQDAYDLRREEAEAQLQAFEEENRDYAGAVNKTSAGTAFTPRF